MFVFSLAFGWAVLSYQFISNGIIAGLVALAGPVQPSTLSPYLTRAIITVMLFLAYELGYWAHHWLSHKVPLLWELHKVHHTAEVLTPLTNYRVHPFDSWFFANVLALSAAVANGLGNYIFGTLYVPSKEREALTFGLADHPDAHTVKGELIDPLINAAGQIRPLLTRRRGEPAPIPATERKPA